MKPLHLRMSALDNAHLRSSSNKAVKRLLQECKELNDEQSRDFTCEPLEVSAIYTISA